MSGKLKNVLTAAWVSAACVLWGGRPARALELVSEAEPLATVVVPRDPKPWTKRAAGWVVEYVQKATGAKLPTVEEPEGATGNVISVGPTGLARRAGVSIRGLKWDGCRLVVRNESTLFLVGRDEAPVEEKRSHIGARGTCRAAVEFLERFLGVRWLAPGPNGEHVPRTRSASVPDDLDLTVEPLFAYAHGRYLYGVDTPGSFANNFRTAVRMKTFGGHSWPVWVSEKEYGATHPEYFYFDGERHRPTRHSHLCTTNHDVKGILLREIRKVFDQGYEWCQLAQSDGFRRCQCPRCEKLDRYRGWKSGDDHYFFHTLRNNPCERVLLLHKEIIDACARSHPDRKVHLLVYGPTSWPSERFDRFGDNVVAEVCPHYERTLPVWRDKVAAQTTYVYFWGTYKPHAVAPKMSLAEVARMIRLFRDNNVIGIYYCGGGECWGLEGPAYYAAGRLMGDPGRSVDALLKEYCEGLYAAAARPMQAFFGELFKRAEATSRALVYAKPWYNAETAYTFGFPPDVLGRLERSLQQAERAADTERSRAWVRLSRETFEYVRDTAVMYHLYRAYLIEKDASTFYTLKKTVADRKGRIDRLLGYSKQDETRWFPGLGQMKRYFTGDRIKHYIRAPANWDFDEMARRHGYRPD